MVARGPYPACGRCRKPVGAGISAGDKYTGETGPGRTPLPSGMTATTRPIPAKALIGMVHVGALPGTPHATTSLHALEHAAVGEARILAEAGFDAIIVENMHDRP